MEVRDERVGDFEVVQTLSELNLTAAACLSPTAHAAGNLASLGGAWEHYSWAKQLQPVNGIQVVMFTYIQALHKVFPSSHPPSMSMLKAVHVIYRHQIFLMLYWVRHVDLPHLNSASWPITSKRR